MTIPIVIKELYTIICQGDSSNELDGRLISLPNVDEILNSLYKIDGEHISLLMLASLYGHDNVVRIILSRSSNVKNLVELTGRVYDINRNLVSSVTALWCACDRGHYTLARTLIKEGKASVDRGPGNPLLIDAVIKNRLKTIKFLVKDNYVNIDGTQQNAYPKYNSLMLSACDGRTEIVTYLLKKGANIDERTPRSHETAVGCAAMGGHLGIVKLLCSAGASTDMKINRAKTAIALALRYNRLHVVKHLIDVIKHEVAIEELELIACSMILSTEYNISMNQAQRTSIITLIRKIFQMTKERNYPGSIMEPIKAYNHQQECQTIEEFDQIQNDPDRLYIEALLIRERILMPKKDKELCAPLLERGEKLIKQRNFESCLHLWEHTFHLYQNMGYATSLDRFVWVFCKMLIANVPIPPQLFIQICRLTLEPSQQNKNEMTLRNALYLVAIAAKILEQPVFTQEERQSIHRWIYDFCRQQHTTINEQTLLHLCVNEQTYLDINNRAYAITQIINFPNLAATQLILTYDNHWINVDAVDLLDGNTALHIISQSDKLDALSIIELLINAGAHLDCLNKHNKTPFDYAKTIEMQTLLQKQQTPSLLKCLCARHIVTQQLQYESIWPAKARLNTFIYLHGCIAEDIRFIGEHP
ncbi:unnamed protein product [Adineta steineri]|uniref:Uncharacterized protein n=1 Tax=Adineta steineri TaxID=433720 RepID=A0A814M258_9BILA|nr:unnamed protein product [Adineta steineri]CAF1072250.1 unnamed protein product [Adineta steineri]